MHTQGLQFPCAKRLWMVFGATFFGLAVIATLAFQRQLSGPLNQPSNVHAEADSVPTNGAAGGPGVAVSEARDKETDCHVASVSVAAFGTHAPFAAVAGVAAAAFLAAVVLVVVYFAGRPAGPTTDSIPSQVSDPETDSIPSQVSDPDTYSIPSQVLDPEAAETPDDTRSHGGAGLGAWSVIGISISCLVVVLLLVLGMRYAPGRCGAVSPARVKSAALLEPEEFVFLHSQDNWVTVAVPEYEDLCSITLQLDNGGSLRQQNSGSRFRQKIDYGQGKLAGVHDFIAVVAVQPSLVKSVHVRVDFSTFTMEGNQKRSLGQRGFPIQR